MEFKVFVPFLSLSLDLPFIQLNPTLEGRQELIML
jgi:hypothetical protein